MSEWDHTLMTEPETVEAARREAERRYPEKRTGWLGVHTVERACFEAGVEWAEAAIRREADERLVEALRRVLLAWDSSSGGDDLMSLLAGEIEALRAIAEYRGRPEGD